MGRNKVFHGFTNEEIELQMAKKRRLDRDILKLLEDEVCHGFTTDSIDEQVKKKNKLQHVISLLKNDIHKMEVVETSNETANKKPWEKLMAGEFVIFST